jgi:hypothetical protein
MCGSTAASTRTLSLQELYGDDVGGAMLNALSRLFTARLVCDYAYMSLAAANLLAWLCCMCVCDCTGAVWR